MPEAAEWLCRGRERELLSWFFWHLSYAGGQVSAVRRVRATSFQAGRAARRIEYYATVWQDALDSAELKEQPLSIPGLALGGEASSGPALQQIWGAVLSDFRGEVIPKAGHWLVDENPGAVADALLAFFRETEAKR